MLRMKAMRSVLERPLHMCYSNYAMYFTHKVHSTNSSIEMHKFPIASETALELLMTANVLDC